MCITVNKYQLVTEYLENGSLFDQLHQTKANLNDKDRFDILDDIFRETV